MVQKKFWIIKNSIIIQLPKLTMLNRNLLIICSRLCFRFVIYLKMKQNKNKWINKDEMH